MDNKLSELSKPVGFVSKQAQTLLKSGDTASVRPFFDVQGSSPLYSQEYVSALLARIAEMEAGHQEAAKQIASWRRIAKQNIEEREKDLAALDAERQKITGLEAKLATPVRLPNKNDDEFWFDNVFQVAKFDREVERAIRAAGFTVEGDE